MTRFLIFVYFGSADPFSMLVETALLPDKMEEFVREVGNLSSRLDPLGGDSLCHNGHENVRPLRPVVVDFVTED